MDCHLRKPQLLVRRCWSGVVYAVSQAILLSMILGGCSETTTGSSNTSARPVLQNSSPEDIGTRSISSMEALNRGLAAITPPGAVMKDIYYDFDSPELRDDARETLKQNGEWMKANPAARVEIEGHCDDTGSAEYNLALGAKRAQIAKEFLVSHGVEANRLVTISYGKEAPACLEQTEECRLKNRRARFVVFTDLPTL
jgi:peptidoglycan-associated lipoprotein